jgi:hypothetical protein
MVLVGLLGPVHVSEARQPEAERLTLTPKGVTCNTVKREKLAECIVRMLNDPSSPYSPDHVRTAAEDRPVRAPQRVAASAAAVGSWRIAAALTTNGEKVNAIHASLLKSGKVLITAGSGNRADNLATGTFRSWTWNPFSPSTPPVLVPNTPKDLFCSGHLHLQDGTPFFFGGTLRYPVAGNGGYRGMRETYKFDEPGNRYVFAGLMNVGSWYPNGIANAIGNPIRVAGFDESGVLTTVNETYSTATGQWTALPGNRLFPMYPGMYLLKSGLMFYSGTYFSSRVGVGPGIWKWTDNTWQPVPGLPEIDCRDQAGSVMLHPAQSQQVMVMGGGCAVGVTGSTAIATLNSTPSFKAGPPLPFSSMHVCALNLPDKSVFVSGGGDHNAAPRLRAAILRPGATSWQEVASPSVPRLYHNTCLLLPDGSVLTMGTNPAAADGVENRAEIYKPWYFSSPRTTITSMSRVMELGGRYTVGYTGPAVSSAVLLKMKSDTHSTDPNARSIHVGVVRNGTGKVYVYIDPNRGVVPPGMYRLFLLDSQGVPSTIGPGVQIVLPKPTTRTGSAPAAAVPCCCC